MSSDDELLSLLQRLPGLSYYQILGLPHRYATPAEVKQAFHGFALLYHPDLFLNADEFLQLAAKEVFKRAVEGYEVLRDAMLQRRYVENFLKRGKLRLPPEEFSRRATIAAGGQAPSIPPAPPSPASLKPRTWVDEMTTEDGREVADRIERMIQEGRYQAALQQMALLIRIENTPRVQAKEAYLRRMVERTRR
ncbi:MAG: DnaJ domain-containing protein [Myxococcales bacterium]|nr:DnaJ domain-containing protein [Polyangiaceae bacterium]MDW8249038.1 DnaJ domain-containing protein [Myxococcales bacterium]